MPEIIERETEVAIKSFSKMNLSVREIKNKIFEDGINISIGSISNVLNKVGIRRETLSKGEKMVKVSHSPLKLTPQTIQKVNALVKKKNPATYKHIQNKLSIS